MTNSDIPDWMMRHLGAARKLYGLDGAGWLIKARLTDKPGGDPENNGAVTVNAVYQYATIELRDELKDDADGQDACYHEMLHVRHDAVDAVTRKLLARLEPTERELLEAEYNEAVERFVTSTTRAVLAYLREVEE